MYKAPNQSIILPLNTPEIYSGEGHNLKDIATMIFWVKPTWKPNNETAKDRMIVSFSGCLVKRDLKYDKLVIDDEAVSGLTIAISESRKSLIFKRADLEKNSVDFDFTADEFYFIVLSFHPTFIEIRINEGDVLYSDKKLLKELNFEFSKIMLGDDLSNNYSKFDGEISGLSLWNTFIKNKSELQAIAEWDNLAQSPTLDNGFKGITNKTTELIAFLTNVNEKASLEFFGNSLSIMGTWAENQTLVDSGLPIKENIPNIDQDKHCVYKETSYIAIIYDNNDQPVLIPGSGKFIGQVFKLVSVIDGKFSFSSDDRNVRCDIKFERKVVHENIPDKVNGTIINVKIIDQFLTISSQEKLQVPTTLGKYVRPFRKVPNQSNNNEDSIFGKNLSAISFLFVGRDIMQINPFNPLHDGRKANKIFRRPPGNSMEFSSDQNELIPFGIYFIPYQSFIQNTKTSFVKTERSFESYTEESTSYEKQWNLDFNGSANVPGIGNYGVDFGFRTGWNSSLNETIGKMNTKEKMNSFAKWETTVYDLVLDKYNIYLSGIPYLDSDDSTPKSSNFFMEINELKDSITDNDIDLFLGKFGTHYVVSATMGACGQRIDKCDNDVVDILLETNSTMKIAKEWNVGFNSRAEKNGGPGIGYSSKSSQSSDEGDTKEDLIEVKTESVIISSVGAQGDGSSVSSYNPVEIRRHMQPIADVLLPPFTEDFDLITKVRPKLIERTQAYVAAEAKKFGQVAFEEQSYYEITLGPRNIPLNIYNASEVRSYLQVAIANAVSETELTLFNSELSKLNIQANLGDNGYAVQLPNKWTLNTLKGFLGGKITGWINPTTEFVDYTNVALTKWNVPEDAQSNLKGPEFLKAYSEQYKIMIYPQLLPFEISNEQLVNPNGFTLEYRIQYDNKTSLTKELNAIDFTDFESGIVAGTREAVPIINNSWKEIDESKRILYYKKYPDTITLQARWKLNPSDIKISCAYRMQVNHKEKSDQNYHFNVVLKNLKLNGDWQTLDIDVGKTIPAIWDNRKERAEFDMSNSIINSNIFFNKFPIANLMVDN